MPAKKAVKRHTITSTETVNLPAVKKQKGKTNVRNVSAVVGHLHYTALLK